VPGHPAYLVERYLCAADLADLAAAVSRLADACRATYGTPGHVEHVISTVVPAEDTCFCVFRAASRSAVEAVNRTARFSYDRICGAELFAPAKGSDE
jgi:hypothetical protein